MEAATSSRLRPETSCCHEGKRCQWVRTLRTTPVESECRAAECSEDFCATSLVGGRSGPTTSPETKEARFWASSVCVAVVVFVASQMSDVGFEMVVRGKCWSCFVRVQGRPLVFAKSFGFLAEGPYSPLWFLKMFLCVCQFDQFFALCSVATRVRVVERGPYDNVGFRR